MGPAELIRRRDRPAVLPAGHGQDSRSPGARDIGYKVARILDACLAEGIVKIEINPRPCRPELLSAYAPTYGCAMTLLCQARFPRSASTPSTRRPAADLLAEKVNEDDVLGVSWAGRWTRLAQQAQGLPPCQIVQMTGMPETVQRAR